MQPIKEYLNAELDNPTHFDKHMAKKACRFVLIDPDLYKRGYLSPLLKCLSKEQVEYVMKEIHLRVSTLDIEPWQPEFLEHVTIGRH